MSRPRSASQFPSSLLRISRWERLVGGSVPVVVMRPDDRGSDPLPMLLWFHGRTVNKELDAGRYLRLVRCGIACVAVDLPGHGERLDESMHEGARTLEIVEEAASEVDALLSDLASMGGVDAGRAAIGGMSAGGMVAMVRGCTEHPFAAMLLEATSGDWRFQRDRPMFRGDLVEKLNPIDHLADWREIAVLALHCTGDEWVHVEGQRRFIEALKNRAREPSRIELHEYAHTGAPHEHMGFGRMAGDAKERGTRFIHSALTGLTA